MIVPSTDLGWSQTTNYVWDVNRGLPQVLTDGTNKYAYGLDLISATDGAGATTYFTTDGLGSTTDITNSAGVKTDGYTYDAFGAATHSPGASPNSWQFTGEQTDADSGLQYLRARYYDPGTGRFLSKDPLSVGNVYTYVDNDPLNWVDPRGLASEGPGMGLYLGAVGAACVAGAVTGPGDTVICGGSAAAAAAVIVVVGGTAICIAHCDSITDTIGDAAGDACSWLTLCSKGRSRFTGDPRTAQEIISAEKKGSIIHEGDFPGEWLDDTYDEIKKAADAGNRHAKRAKKLLDGNEYNK